MFELIKTALGYGGIALLIYLATRLVWAATGFVNSTASALDRIPFILDAIRRDGTFQWAANLNASGGSPADTSPVRPQADAGGPPSGDLEGSGGGPAGMESQGRGAAGGTESGPG